MFLRTASMGCLASILAAQGRTDVLVVAPSGAPYTSIQAAVNAGSNGDIVLVRNGFYPEVVTINAKSLTVCADVGAIVTVTRARVQGLLASQSVTLRGLGATVVTAEALRIDGCLGSVRVQGCVWRATPNATGACAVRVVSSDDVAFTTCTVETSPLMVNPSTGITEPGIRVSSSRAAFYGCLVSGSYGRKGEMTGPSPDRGEPGREALLAVDAEVFASGTRFLAGRGGDGYDSTWPPPCSNPYFYPTSGGPGGDGMVLAGSSNAILLGSSFLPGAGGEGGTDLCGGHATNGADGVPVSGSGSATMLPGEPRGASLPPVVREGQSLPLHFGGQCGDLVYAVIADAHAYAYQPALSGTLLIEPPLRRVYLGTIDGSGALSTALPVAELGLGVEGLVWKVQAFFLDVAGQAWLGPNGDWVLLDAAF